MPIPLEEWHKRLDTHFRELSVRRSAANLPLFALEHNLTADEFIEIAELLREQLSLGKRFDSHWLAWVVYATELGYDYDGDEYWRSFEERTPRWRDLGSRNLLRLWFAKFHATYHGVKPTGPWAEWFKIIAWPITHSILPKYLQWQFARALYNLRFSLVQLRDRNPSAVGRLLAAHAWDASSRFQEFLQQQELTGRIVLALVDDTNAAGSETIEPGALRRIVADLERVQSAREWLKEARRYVADRVHGAARTFGNSPFEDTLPDDETSEDRGLSIRLRPTFLLRRAGSSRWSPVIEVPSFSAVARLNPELHTFLQRTRCKIFGTGDNWLPHGWLLSGPQRRLVKSWPAPAVPLLKFERSNALLEGILASTFTLSSGPYWLFRIGTDGLAREVISRVVRPGRNYILLTTRNAVGESSLLQPCDVDCEEVRATLLEMPAVLNPAEAGLLEGLGLQIARTIRVWPAGPPARVWDGEGHSEWLTTDQPCFGLAHDHAVDSYSLCLDDAEEATITAASSGATFVSLPLLSAGQHKLVVKGRRAYQPLASPSAEGVITLSVREPEPWVPGTTSHAGLFVSIEPSDLSLDQFWENKAAVSVMGPHGHQVVCSITLSKARGTELLSETVGTFELPVTPEEWRQKFAHFVAVEKREWAHLEAGSGKLTIKDEELGEYALRLDRDVKPIRWVCRAINRGTTARLVDDTGLEQDRIECSFRGFGRPGNRFPLDVDRALLGQPIAVPGGLFLARRAQFSDAIVVSMPQIEGGFQGLIIEPDLSDLNSPRQDVVELIELIHLWTHARAFGPLVLLRRQRVVERLCTHLYSRLCGSRWAEAESAFISNRQAETTLRQLEHAIGGTTGFGVLLRRDRAKFERGSPAGLEWFSDIASRYQVSPDKGLSEFAMQLGSEPHALISLPRPVLDRLLLEVKDKAILLRGARFLALVTTPPPVVTRSDGEGRA